MIRVKTETQYIIFVMLFLIAGFIGVKQAGFLKKTKSQKIESKIADEKFSNNVNSMKIKLSYQTDDLNEVISEIRSLMANNDVEELYSRKQSNNFLGLYEINKSNKKIIDALRSNNALVSESMERNDNSNYVINIKSNLENYRINKREITKQLSSSAISTSTKRSLRKDLAKVQAKIDSLEYLPTLLKKSNETELIYITVLPISANSLLNLRSVKTFIKVFLMILFVEILAVVMLYYVIVFMSKLLKIMGVKTPRSRSSNYNYNYNNYYGRGKKIKRVYKDHKEPEKK